MFCLWVFFYWDIANAGLADVEDRSKGQHSAHFVEILRSIQYYTQDEIISPR